MAELAEKVASRPPRNAMIVGSPPTRSVSASFGYASESSFPTRAVAPSSAAALRSSGAMSWQGPHHVA